MIIGNPITLGGGGGGYELPEYAVSFLALEEFTVSLNITNIDGILEYSTDGKKWNIWDGTATSSKNGFFSLRGTGNTIITGSGTVHISISTAVMCVGNIETLLDWQTVKNGGHPQMGANCFKYLFYNSSIITPPSLPATDLSASCYAYMFAACHYLTFAPQLPATVLAESCYANMFQGSSIRVTPSLNAQTLAVKCYEHMFENCVNLTDAPPLPATTLQDYCYRSMFEQCSGLLGPPALPATTLPAGCYARMFRNCTRIKLSETQTGIYEEPYIIPSSGTGTAATGALNAMFTGTSGTFAGTPTINKTYYTEFY